MSKTLDNLMEAFNGESQANRKYTAYAKKAEKDGKKNAAKLFRAAADAETIHALKHFEVTGKTGSTAENLSDARLPVKRTSTKRCIPVLCKQPRPKAIKPQ